MPLKSDPSTITDWLQAVSAIATGGLALVTYTLSRGMYHAPYRTFLRPTKVKSSSDYSVEVHLLNIGPGIAYNVTISSLCYKNLKIDPLVPNKTWYEEYYLQAKGPEEIKQDQTLVYEFEESTLFLTEPIIINWETITGKKVKMYWKYSRAYKETYFSRLSQFEIIIFKLKRAYKTTLSPMVRLRKYFVFRKTKQINK